MNYGFLKIRKAIEEAENVNLAPVMSLFVILVPVLLTTAAFLKFSIVKASFPESAKQHLKADNKSLLSLSLHITEKGFTVISSVKNSPDREKIAFHIPLKRSKYQFELLQKKLLEIKKAYPEHSRVNLYPKPEISYETIIKTIDTSREKAAPSNRYSKGRAKSEYLFPDVVWMGLKEAPPAIGKIY